MGWDDSGLTEDQVAFCRRVLPGSRIVADDSWGLLDTRVLHVRGPSGDHTVKASGPANTHFPRELEAHRRWTTSLVEHGDTSRLVAVDETARVLVLDRLAGHLALGTPDEHDPEVHRQAGALLRRFHDQAARVDHDFLPAEQRKALASLTARHRIPPETVERTRAALLSHEPGPVTVVPTHGDWHPRNWIVHGRRLHAIDFGRFALRPAPLDLTRLAVLHWQADPGLEEAFFAGYGDDPRDPALWRWFQLREAVGTAVWAFAVQDEVFEAQGHRMLADALAAFGH